MTITFNVKVEGLDKLTKAFEKAPQIVEPIMQQAVIKAGAILASHTDKTTTPYKSGTLVGSFDPITIGRLFARWFPRVNYARAVQFGMPSSKGRFVPAIGKRLKNGKNIGVWPGFPGRHFMEKIRSASTREIDELFGNALDAVVKRMIE